MKCIDLSGNWSYMTDYNDEGIVNEYYNRKFELGGFKLPGSACENQIGKKQEYYSEMSKEAVRAPRERYEYIAPLWLQREIFVPEEFVGKNVKLFLERVNIASDLWVDGKKIGRQTVELSAPHIYDLGNQLTCGKHNLTIRIDNRNLLNLDVMASGYSVDTQGYWNGIIGNIELRCEEIFHLENIQVYPDENGISVKLTQTSDVYSPFERRNAKLDLTVITPDGKELPTKHFSYELFNSRQVDYLSYEFDNIQYWNEFEPMMYTLIVNYSCENITDEKKVKFGMRTIKTENKQILLNDTPISLRGTIDCAIYPRTGYPPTDVQEWIKNFKTIKSYGLNHVRFHAWCPPDAAFCAADEIGIYVSVEMPLWLNKDVCALEVGQDAVHRTYFTQEAVTISKTYGNHPSFIMFSNGNENMGDFELLDDIISMIKAYDKRRIYTLTTNFDHPVLPCEDYLCAYEASGHKVRLQDIQDIAAESTCVDYSEAVRDTKVPVISFEVGQYCVYPDVNVIEKYTGNILPTNFDVIKKEMLKKNVYHKLEDYVKASGDLAAKLYKEDIEAALRTKKFGGFELLSLCDYTGQSTATVGVLDAFFDSKGIIEPERFRRFSNCVVPLFKSRRIFKNTDTLEAELDLYDYGQCKIENPEFELTIYNNDKIFYQAKTEQRTISVPLVDIQKSSMLKVELKVKNYVNDWNIYVFSDYEVNTDLEIVKNADELKNIIKNGGRAIVSTDCVKEPIDGSFIPVFWSPVHFPSQKPCGAIIDECHSVFKNFPTGKYPDYQWKKILDGSRGMNISSFGNGFMPIIETVPNFVDNTLGSPLFEAKIGNADILFCGFDMKVEDEASKCLIKEIFRYVASENFSPENIIDVRTFIELIK